VFKGSPQHALSLRTCKVFLFSLLDKSVKRVPQGQRDPQAAPSNVAVSAGAETGCDVSEAEARVQPIRQMQSKTRSTACPALKKKLYPVPPKGMIYAVFPVCRMPAPASAKRRQRPHLKKRRA